MGLKKTLNSMDIYSPEFDHFLELKLENITPTQIELLEHAVQHKITKYKSKSIQYMTLAEKMHICSIAFSMPVVLSVMDEEKGISEKEFKNVVKAKTSKLKNSEALAKLEGNSIFVLSDRQVMDSLLYMNYMQTTDIYNLIRMNNPRVKGKRELEYNKKQQVLGGVIGTLVQFESLKRRVLEQNNINLPKFYGLLFFYKKERLCKDFYDEQFKYAYSKSRGDLSRGLAEMARNGLLSKRGTTIGLTYNITSKGIDLLVKILNKLLYDV